MTHPASPKYPGQGELTLINGEKGSSTFTGGQWLGFEQDDLEVTLDFGEIKSINKITVGFLENIGAWIFMPRQIEYYISTDGNQFQKIAEMNHQEIADVEGSGLKDIVKEFENVKTQYLRLKAKNIGLCPEGHPGAGGKAWVFVDEIVVE